MNKRWISIGCLLFLWFTLALIIQNDVILPSPMDVGVKLIELGQTSTFYLSIAMTFLRAHIAFVLSLIIGIALALLCYRYKELEDVLSIWIKGLQTIPQISFIIFLYFWLSAEWCIYVVVILMAFPIAYFNYLEGLKNISTEYTHVIQMTNHSWWHLVRKIYLPMCYPQLMATLKGALPLSLKVSVMSEVLIYTSTGIGKQLSLAKTAIDMVSVFAWTFAFVVLVSLETHLLTTYLDKKTTKKV